MDSYNYYTQLVIEIENFRAHTEFMHISKHHDEDTVKDEINEKLTYIRKDEEVIFYYEDTVVYSKDYVLPEYQIDFAFIPGPAYLNEV